MKRRRRKRRRRRLERKRKRLTDTPGKDTERPERRGGLKEGDVTDRK